MDYGEKIHLFRKDCKGIVGGKKAGASDPCLIILACWPLLSASHTLVNQSGYCLYRHVHGAVAA